MRPHHSSATILMTRRRMLGAATALSAAALLQLSGGAFAAEPDADAFLNLSQNLTGKSDLSSDFAARMLADFTQAGRADALSALIEGGDDADLSNDIVASWYSGTSPDPESATVVTYTDALMWGAMSYTKPMAYCGGGVGYWAEAPET